jgi:hypothetical protein
MAHPAWNRKGPSHEHMAQAWKLQEVGANPLVLSVCLNLLTDRRKFEQSGFKVVQRYGATWKQIKPVVQESAWARINTANKSGHAP